MAPASAISAAAGPITTAETNHASTTEAIGSGIASETLVEATQETLGDSRVFIWLSFAAFFCFIQALSAQRLVEQIRRCDLLYSTGYNTEVWTQGCIEDSLTNYEMFCDIVKVANHHISNFLKRKDVARIFRACKADLFERAQDPCCEQHA